MIHNRAEKVRVYKNYYVSKKDSFLNPLPFLVKIIIKNNMRGVLP